MIHVYVKGCVHHEWKCDCRTRYECDKKGSALPEKGLPLSPKELYEK